jgi:hypothetical protein
MLTARLLRSSARRLLPAEFSLHSLRDGVRSGRRRHGDPAGCPARHRGAMSNLRPQLTLPRPNALPTKRAICTKHSIVIDRRRGNHQVASVGCHGIVPRHLLCCAGCGGRLHLGEPSNFRWPPGMRADVFADPRAPRRELSTDTVVKGKYAVPTQSWCLRASGDCPSCMSCRPSLKTCSI